MYMCTLHLLWSRNVHLSNYHRRFIHLCCSRRDRYCRQHSNIKDFNDDSLFAENSFVFTI